MSIVTMEYLDTRAVADLLGVRAETVNRYKHRDETFPEPDITLSACPGWLPDHRTMAGTAPRSRRRWGRQRKQSDAWQPG